MVVAHSANLVAADITSNNTKCVQASADATGNKVTFTCSGLPVGRNTVKFLTAKNSEWLQPPPSDAPAARLAMRPGPNRSAERTAAARQCLHPLLTFFTPAA